MILSTKELITRVYNKYDCFKIDDLNLNGTASGYYNSGSFRFNMPASFQKLLNISNKKSGKYCAEWRYFYRENECNEYIKKLYAQKTIFFIIIPKKNFDKSIIK